MKPVCLVMGAGAGIGGNVGKRFAKGGYHAVLCRRSDEEGLSKLVESIEAEGGSASGFLLNAIEADSIEDRVAAVEKEIGPIEDADPPHRGLAALDQPLKMGAEEEARDLVLPVAADVVVFTEKPAHIAVVGGHFHRFRISV